jgi:hypothetical protein
VLRHHGGTRRHGLAVSTQLREPYQQRIAHTLTVSLCNACYAMHPGHLRLLSTAQGSLAKLGSLEKLCAVSLRAVYAYYLPDLPAEPLVTNNPLCPLTTPTPYIGSRYLHSEVTDRCCTDMPNCRPGMPCPGHMCLHTHHASIKLMCLSERYDGMLLHCLAWPCRQEVA